MSRTTPSAHSSEPSPDRGFAWRSVLLFCVGFAVYQTSLALTAEEPYPDFWLFAADSYRMLLTQLGELHPMAIYQAKKHFALVVVGTPLHRLGDFLYGFAPEPFHENLALSFPGAVFGGLNLSLAYALFRKTGFRANAALLPTVLYGAGTSIWLYASFPETYILSTLASNVFLLAFLRDPLGERWKRLVGIQALACFCAPPQLALAVLPTVHRWRVLGLRSASRFALRYGAGLTLLYVLPYMALSALHPSQWVRPRLALNAVREIRDMADWQHLLRPGDWSIVVGAFAFLSQLGSFIPPLEYEAMTADLVWRSTPGTWIVASCVVSYLAVGFLRRSEREPFVGATAVAAFCAAYVASFVFLNPPESFVYPAPFVLPLWLWIHGFHVKHQDRRSWRIGIAAACLVCIALNGRYVIGIHEHDPGHGRVETGAVRAGAKLLSEAGPRHRVDTRSGLRTP